MDDLTLAVARDNRIARASVASIGLTVIVLGLLVLIGWSIGATALVQPFSRSRPLSADAGLAYAFCGLGIVGLALDRLRWGIVGGAIAGLIGIAEAAPQMLGADLGIGSLVEGLIGAGPAAPGGMPGFAAGLFTIAGATIIGGAGGNRARVELLAGVGIALLTLSSIPQLLAATSLGDLPQVQAVVYQGLNGSVGFGLIAVALVLYGLWARGHAGKPLVHWLAWLGGAVVAAISIRFGWEALRSRGLDVEQTWLPSMQGPDYGLAETAVAAGLMMAALLVVVANMALRARAQLADRERQYRTIFEDAPVAMTWIGRDGRFLKVNRAFSDYSGFSAEELAELGPVDIVHPSEKHETGLGIQRMLAGEVDKTSLVRKHVRKNGDIAWGYVSVAAIRTQGERPSFLLVHIQDVTARKMAEEQLFQAQKMEALGNLAGGIAHDFNNMLLPIIALTEMARDDLARDSPTRENLDNVLQAAHRAAHLVGRILAFSRHDEREKSEIDIAECVEDALRLLGDVLPSSITMHKDVDSRVGTVMADAAELHSVIMNLGSNAADAMTGRVGSLSVGLTRAEATPRLAARMPALEVGKAYAKITLADTGCGMDRATMEKIFNPFFTTKPVGEGTGLGLAMVHGIVERLGGAIDVTSELGVGTTFDIYLPLRDGAEDAAAAVDSPAQRARGKTSGAGLAPDPT